MISCLDILRRRFSLTVGFQEGNILAIQLRLASRLGELPPLRSVLPDLFKARV
jgi:hypothetical protein